jgi:hypothetical protein
VSGLDVIDVGSAVRLRIPTAHHDRDELAEDRRAYRLCRCALTNALGDRKKGAHRGNMVSPILMLRAGTDPVIASYSERSRVRFPPGAFALR